MKLPASFYVLPIALTGLGLVISCSSDDPVEDDSEAAGGEGGEGTGGKASGDGDGDGDGDMGGGGGMSGECPSDNDPCTEDVMNDDTGKCGVPRSGNTCDDGVYCNGEDTCNKGKCSDHAGDPCDETSCNEGKKACECATAEHCPGADLGGDEWGTLGEFGECTYANACSLTGTRTRVKTTYACEAGACVASPGVDTDNACGARSTDCDCTPGTYKCDPYENLDSSGSVSSAGELLIKCLTNGTWEDDGSSGSWTATCAVGKCNAGTGKCTTMFEHPRDANFDVPQLLRGSKQIEQLFDQFGLDSDFG